MAEEYELHQKSGMQNIYTRCVFLGGTGNVLYSHYEIKRQSEIWQPVATKDFVNVMGNTIWKLVMD